MAVKPFLSGAFLIAAASLLVAVPSLAVPRQPSPHGRRPTAQVQTEAVKSVGSPTEGHLEGGVRLADSPSVKMLQGHDRRWGLPQLVGMLERSAAKVRKKFPGSVLRVGDLSRRGGGDVSGHHSHESGRDVDVAFFAMHEGGKPVNLDQLVSFDDSGRAGRLRFDDARNWALIEAWLNDSQARVSHIFVAAPLRDRLLAFARAQGVPSSLRTRAAFALMQPKGGLPHDNHFHVRIACPPSQRSTCVEYATRESAREAREQRADHGHKGKVARHSHPVVAKARKRVGTVGRAAPPMVSVVPAPHDFGDARADAHEVTDLEDEGGELRVTR
jgi:penicillin-insensitive murein endopeptidase